LNDFKNYRNIFLRNYLRISYHYGAKCENHCFPSLEKVRPPICYFSIAKRHLNGNKKVANIGLSTQSNVALHNQSQIGYTLCKNCDDKYFATFLLPFATFLLPK
jgi:hypothetical protein